MAPTILTTAATVQLPAAPGRALFRAQADVTTNGWAVINSAGEGGRWAVSSYGDVCVTEAGAANLQAGPHSLVLRAFGGGVSPPTTIALSVLAAPPALDDGSAAAPPGAPNWPSLLAGYVARPSWRVAAVDYRVGPLAPPTNDWRTMTAAALGISGGTVDVQVSTGRITITGASSFTISGWDCASNGGAWLYLVGCTGVTVCDNAFGGSNLKTIPVGVITADPGCKNITIVRNTIDGGGPGVGSTLISAPTTVGGLTVQYNDMQSAPQHFIELSGATVTVVNLDYRFNFIGNGALAAGAHLNHLQLGAAIVSGQVCFNTACQDGALAGQIPLSAGEGFQFYGDFGGRAQDIDCCNNTIIARNGVAIAPNGVAMSYLVHGGAPHGVCRFQNNYLSWGVNGGAWGPRYGSSLSGWQDSGNVCMDTGAAA